MAEGGARLPRHTSVVYSRLGDSEDEREAAAAAGMVYREDWTEPWSAWEEECQDSPGLEQLLQQERCPTTGYQRFSSTVPRLRLRHSGANGRLKEEAPEELSPDQPLWKLDLQVRKPRLEDISCCNVCLGTRWNPYPVTFEIITMSDSPLLCANYMVTRRSDEDFIRLYNSLRSLFTYNTGLRAQLAEHKPMRLAQISDDALTLQCGRHKKLLKWILSNSMFYSSHDLHAFIGCKVDSCPSQRTDAVKKFPQYPAGTQRCGPEE